MLGFIFSNAVPEIESSFGFSEIEYPVTEVSSSVFVSGSFAWEEFSSSSLGCKSGAEFDNLGTLWGGPDSLGSYASVSESWETSRS